MAGPVTREFCGMQKMLLLNPPWNEKYIRDKYCSASSKANYLWYPTDLIAQTGILKNNYDLYVIDCIAEKLDFDSALAKICDDLKPHAVLSLTGSKSYLEDMGFLLELKHRLPELKIFLSGGIALYNGDLIMNLHGHIDGILYDYTSADVDLFMQQKYDDITNMIYRYKDHVVEKGPDRKSKTFSIGISGHGMFRKELYAFPLTIRKHYAAVITAFGCPYACNFCVYANLGYKTRNTDELVDELKLLKQNGIDEVFFADPTFGANKSYYVNLLERVLRENIKIVWSCNSRVDVTDSELLELMERAGCHCIFYGVENADNNILKMQNKHYTVDDVRQTFKICEKLGIRTAGYFMFGLPGETEQTILKTIRLARELNCYIASFNIAAPLEGTTLRDDLVKKGIITKDDIGMMDISENHTLPLSELSPAQVEKYRDKAYRDFYFRPWYIVNRLRKLKSFREFMNMYLQGGALSKYLFRF